MTPVLEARGLTVRAGRATLLDGVSLALAPGELLVVAGPNGAGKSTLLRVLEGDLMPARGEVLLYGRPLTAHRSGELARLRAVLPQETALAFPFSVGEVVRMGRWPWLGDPARDEALVAAALDACDVGALVARSVPTLSGGERTRVALARVLAQDTPILLLDEPTAALDLRHREAVLRVARARADDGRAVLAVLHDLNLAAAWADRIVLLDRGTVRADGPPGDVLTADLLSRLYGAPVLVTRHPTRDHPLVVSA